MALTTRLTTRLEASYTSPLDLSSPVDALDWLMRLDLASGTGENQADLLWHDQRTIDASSSETLDLVATLTDAFGDALTFVELKLLLVRAAAANTNNVQVSATLTSGVTGLFLADEDGLSVYPGGLFLWVAPETGPTVTATSADTITFANSGAGTGVTYDVVIIGTSV